MEQASHFPGVFGVLRLMEDHIADPLSLKQVALLAGLNNRQFQRQIQADPDHADAWRSWSRIEVRSTGPGMRSTASSSRVATRPGILRPVGAPSNEVAQGMEPVIGTDAHPA